MKPKCRRTVSVGPGYYLWLQRLAEQEGTAMSALVQIIIGQAALKAGVPPPSDEEVEAFKEELCRRAEAKKRSKAERSNALRMEAFP